MLDIFYSAKFKKDYKRIVKQGRDTEILFRVVALLANEQPLPAQYKDHALTGGYGGHRECHQQPDWLLIYLREDDTLVLTLSRTGTHSDLFKK